MSLIKGKWAPRFQLLLGTEMIEDFTLEKMSNMKEGYEPIVVEHELQDDEIRRKLKGYRYTCEITYDAIHAGELNKLSRFFHNVTVTFPHGAVETGYERCYFYPNSVDYPLFKLDVVIASDARINLEGFLNLAQKDFILKLVSRRRLDYVPLNPGQDWKWGNIFFSFNDKGTVKYNQAPDYNPAYP